MTSTGAVRTLVAAAWLAAGTPAAGEPPPDGFERAAALPKLFAKHRPFAPRLHWLPADRGVWFETGTPAGGRCVLVDAATGARREAETPAALGLVSDPEARLEPRAGWRKSPGGGAETHMVFVNAFDRPVRIFWCDFEGRLVPYGTVAPGAERRQHTFAGHHWVGDFAADDLAGVFVAAAGGGRATFDDDSRRIATPRDAEPAGAAPRLPAVFVRDDDLFLRDESGEHRLTTDGRADDTYAGAWSVSPDGTRAFGFQTVPGERRELVLVESSPRDRLQPRVIRRDYAKPGDRIAVPRPRLFDLAARRRIPLDDTAFAEPWSIDRVRWAEDSSEVFCLYNRRGHQLLRLVGIDAATGRVRTVAEETSPTFVDYSQKTFLHWLPGGREALWMSERDGFNHLYLIDVAGGTARQITSGPWNVRRVERVDAAARQVWFTALGIHPGQDPYHRHLARVALDGGAATPLTAADATHEWTFSPDGGLFVDRFSRVDLPWVTQLRRSADGALVAELGRDDAAELLAAGFRPPERFAAPGRDGRTAIHGILIRPTASAAGGGPRYPVIEDIYAGPQDHHVPKA